MDGVDSNNHTTSGTGFRQPQLPNGKTCHELYIRIQEIRMHSLQNKTKQNENT